MYAEPSLPVFFNPFLPRSRLVHSLFRPHLMLRLHLYGWLTLFYFVFFVNASPSCTLDYAWMSNSLNQSPCQVTFVLSPLGTSQLYGQASDNPCECNTVMFSLLSACAICQGNGGTGDNLRHYTKYCTNVLSGTYPKDYNTTAIPHWTFQNVGKNGMFDVVKAERDHERMTGWVSISEGPEATFRPIVTSTTSIVDTRTTTILTTSFTTVAPTEVAIEKISKPNTGAIVGGVIGGVAGLALISGGVIVWLYHRKQPRKHVHRELDSPRPLSNSPSDTYKLPVFGYQGNK
ncbi:hypothetical protein AMATHDRAFT_49480 [Amanita thiersii Skay4041]|uniref:Mid2 domain-containing protein n=1 Tax=Amanita thiersii Skay4041 TaxID=703135 RepID=A0A2A9NEI2_9AGAR|nr:hypothetical protein AMATHDRAFT_49480 [Amanita thiersii Skay4041]